MANMVLVEKMLGASNINKDVSRPSPVGISAFQTFLEILTHPAKVKNMNAVMGDTLL